MKKYLGFVAVSVFLFSCTEAERNNPYDELAVNYIGNAPAEPSSSSVVPSSSSVEPSSSSAPPSSSSVAQSSSSAVSCTASNNTQTHYCSEGTMKAYGSVTDDDGNTYKTVVIGTQTWMAENLNYNASGSRCYNNNKNQCDIYGRLYKWATAMNIETSFNENEWGGSDVNHRGICPSGWHIPSDDDWEVLMSAVGGSSVAGTKLKTASGWSFGNGTDDYGFSALPGGNGLSDGSFDGVGDLGRWWSAKEYRGASAYHLGMNNPNSNAGWGAQVKSWSFSVRCVQDYPSSSSVGLSSSSILPSSSSVAPSSSSVVPSSSSTSPSSSGTAPSSSSAVPSSSSNVGCAGFVEGTEREHYGEMKKQFCDVRDGKKYVYVVIGTQTWMAENLNYNADGSKCYDNSEANCETYGKLYNWSTAMNNSAGSLAVPSGIQGVCPAGWHIPSPAEWNALFTFASGYVTAGEKLKAKSGWNSYNGVSGNGTDEYRFSALPGGDGYGYSDGSFYNYIGDSGKWWSTEEQNSNNAASRSINHNGRGIGFGSSSKSSLLSVRCLQD